ncbi:hypothetical protein J6590_015691 [Homalodisca vitripennis]|nr:hypothetical protein J6590_015691 [Homalodisca vitripennis]
MPASIALMIQLMLDNSPIANRALGIVSPELTAGPATCSILQHTGCDSNGRPFTCRLMDLLANSSLITIVYDDLDKAKQAVRKNEIWGVLHFSESYTAAIWERMQFDLFSSNNTVVDASFIRSYLDMSNMWVSNFLRKELMEDVRRMAQTILQDCDINPKIFDIPVKLEPAIFGTNNSTFLEYIIPGIMCTFAFCLAITYSLGAIMFEKNVGLERSLAAGLTKLEVVSAHCAIQLVIALIQEVVMIAIFYYVYDNHYRGNLYLAFLLLVMLQVMGNFFALVIALSHQNEFNASNTGLGSINILFIVCGIIWPVEGMHGVLRNVIWAIPVQPAVEAYRAIVMRDWHLSHPVVYKGFLSTTIWTVIFLLGTIALARRNKAGL